MVKRKSKRKISKRKISKRKSLKNRRYTKKGLINKIGNLKLPLVEPRRISTMRLQHVREFMVVLVRSIRNIIIQPTVHIPTLIMVARERFMRSF